MCLWQNLPPKGGTTNGFSKEAAIKSLRWQIALLISAAIAISYLDRQTLPVAIDAIQREIPINNTQFSHLQVAFLLAYAVMYAGGGKLIDVLGTRRGFLWIMLFWSLACASHGFAAGFGMLALSRFLLGVGEGGGFPAATKAVSEWFPSRERSTAMGIINAGTAVGAVIAPPALAAVIENLGWRWVFFLCGAAGLLWSAWWLRKYFSPAHHPGLSKLERNQIEEVFATPPQEKAEMSWLNLFAFPQVWGLVLGKFLSDAAWYFYLFWLPKYLYDERGFDTKQVGYYGWIPYAAAGIGSLLGGWFSSQLLRRGNSLNFSRKVALGASAAVMPFIIFITQVPIEWAIVLFSVAFFGQQSWSTLVMILPTDLFPRRVVGSVAGLVGFGGAMGGVVFNLIAGRMLDAGFGYGPVFAIVSVLHALAFILLLFTIREVKPLEVKGALA
jgi:ACS family hexuronate transporter-like MFS transporter